MILDGKACSEKLLNSLKEEGIDKHDILAVITVGHDPASAVYVRNKKNAIEKVGGKFQQLCFDCDVDDDTLINEINMLNAHPLVKGIIVQKPLPKHIDEHKVCNTIHPDKDVDGFHPVNLGKLIMNDPTGFVSCTPMGVLTLLKENHISIAGKHCVVIGRSNEVGKPMALLMLNNDATVTICHSKTENLEQFTKMADILIVAIGKPKFINNPEHIKKGAVIIDVGINRDENGKLCGDVDTQAMMDYVSYITPVPGGVGPMTVASLIKNTVKAD